MLSTLDRLDLVAGVAPIQYAIRLLIPEGSRMLELDDVRARVTHFDRKSLTHVWRHADPRVDALQRELEALAGARLNAPREEMFASVGARLHHASGLAVPLRAPASGDRRDAVFERTVVLLCGAECRAGDPGLDLAMSLIHVWRRWSMAPWMRPFTEWRVYLAWSRAGRPVPAPPIVKQRLVRRCLQAHRLDAVVETGTFTGDMVDALMEHARRIVSIELDPRLYTAARRRFDGHPRVQLLHGDSANLLPSVIAGLNGRALFWLDGHYTVGVAGPERESPILNELRALLEAPPQGHVIMVDDIRLFVGRDGYPTVDAIRGLIHDRRPHARVDVADDILCWVDAIA